MTSGGTKPAGIPRFLATLDVVARAVPAQKLALVRAFREAGEVVPPAFSGATVSR
jgi:hypothetical protein